MRVVRTRRSQKPLGVLALLGAGALVLTACSNAKVSVSTTTSSHAPGVYSNKIVVGALATVSGPLSQGFAPVVDGVKAYFDAVNAKGGIDGRKLDLAYVENDQGNPTTDEELARTLVDQDHVFAIVGVGTPFFSGSTFLANSGTPTFGYVVSSQWEHAPNLFGVGGSYLDPSNFGPLATYVAKKVHATSAADVYYSVPQSADACEAAASSLKAAGLTVLSEPLGFSGATPIVVQMKSHQTNLFITCMEQSENLKFMREMHQYGINNFHSIWLNGYSQSMVASHPHVTNGLIFLVEHVPFQAAKKYPSRYPGIVQYIETMKKYESAYTYDDVAFQGYVSAAQFVAGLKAIGHDVTQQRLIDAINSETHFTAGGLIAPVNWKVAHNEATTPICDAFVEAENGAYHLFLVHHGEVFVCVNQQGQRVSAPPYTPGLSGS
jgi:branched-chain amino acid transport system substrate-binding protein